MTRMSYGWVFCLAAVLLVVLAGFAACGGDGSNNGTSKPRGTALSREERATQQVVTESAQRTASRNKDETQRAGNFVRETASRQTQAARQTVSGATQEVRQTADSATQSARQTASAATQANQATQRARTPGPTQTP